MPCQPSQGRHRDTFACTSKQTQTRLEAPVLSSTEPGAAPTTAAVTFSSSSGATPLVKPSSFLPRATGTYLTGTRGASTSLVQASSRTPPSMNYSSPSSAVFCVRYSVEPLTSSSLLR
ncbi:hypothetical protein BHE90_010211 [Fusarium euwallaceae]|uniref:Uncharacterized protein n=3 Tax=Fusarium solani species complex TaxID=232080 RepID=A0A3M2RNN5_9HYPO|nr:hypothetical protein CDV36_013458 [Fusarium kuroshium]RSL80621.1 hypothetical protein CEP51_006452 [Fusarium floridanum]RTE75321.1 hypothetical protein BHE90_010211 [Fusarium euwallaceae]